MSYQLGSRLARADVDFYALVIAAMMRADTENAERLRAAFPELWAETQARYDAPGGTVNGEELTAGMREWLDARPKVRL